MIDEKRLLETLESFTFPRIYGSNAEKKAHLITKKKIEDLGVKSNIQNFSFSRFYSIIYPRITFTVIFGFFLILYLNIGGLFQLISILILSIVFLIAFILSRLTNYKKIGKQVNSQNIYTKINSSGYSDESSSKKKDIILIAHLDSKGQRFHIVNRVKNYFLWSFSLILLIFIIILKNFLFPQYSLIFYILGVIPLIINFFTIIIVILNNTNNDSDGALDDASGVSCIIELLRYYSNSNDIKSKLDNINLWFVLTGAEEGGTQGIRKYYNVMKEEKFKKEHVIVLNFDSIGKNLDFVKFGIFIHKKKLLNLFLNISNDHKVNIKTHRVPFGVHTDGYFLAKKGYQGLEFGDYDSYQYLHSKYDTLDKVDVLILKKLCEIVIDAIKKIDTDFY